MATQTPEQRIAADLGISLDDLHRIAKSERARARALELADTLHETHGRLNMAIERVRLAGGDVADLYPTSHRACALLAEVL